MTKALPILCAGLMLFSTPSFAKGAAAVSVARAAPVAVRVAPAPARVTPSRVTTSPAPAASPSKPAEASSSYFNWAIPAFLLGNASGHAAAAKEEEDKRKGKK